MFVLVVMSAGLQERDNSFRYHVFSQRYAGRRTGCRRIGCRPFGHGGGGQASPRVSPVFLGLFAGRGGGVVASDLWRVVILFVFLEKKHKDGGVFLERKRDV